MADQQQQIPTAPFPAPPPFWKHFTSKNLSRHRALKESKTQSEDIPLELTYLEPPVPPAESYTIFGEEHTLSTHLPSLSSLNITQLYPTTSNGNLNHSYYLLLIIRSLHLNFQELCTILSRNPSLSGPKLEDIKNLFQNAHWLINMYRPHQARESLIAIMEAQLEEGKREMEECERVKRKVEVILCEIEKGSGRDGSIRCGDGRMDLNEQGGSGNIASKSTDEVEDARRLWKMLTNEAD